MTDYNVSYREGYADGHAGRPRVSRSANVNLQAYDDGYSTGVMHRPPDPKEHDTICFWGERRIDDMTREELIEVVKTLGRDAKMWMENTRRAHRFYADLARLRRLREGGEGR